MRKPIDAGFSNKVNGKCSMSTATLYLFFFLLLMFVDGIYSQSYPYVSFMSQTLVNHSYVDITTVGSGSSNNIQCITDLATCCSGAEGSHRGDWYFPDGGRLPFSNGNIDQYRNDRRVELRRFNNANSPTGMYHCEIPTSASPSVRKRVHVGLYTSTGGDVQISEGMLVTMNSDPSSGFTLACISTGGPATTVTWTRDSTILTGGTETVLNDPVTAHYTHTLMVDGGQEGLYRCNVSNNKPSSATAELNVITPPPPSGVGLQQRGEGRLEVTWTPSGGSTVTGYIIYYQLTGGEEMSVIVNGRTTVSANITGLSSGTYSVSMTVTSTSLLSSRTSTETFLIVSPPNTVVNIMAVTATFISLSWTSGGTGVTYEVEWQRDTTGECSDIDRGSETITDGSTSYVILSVEEDSMYTVTVTATNIAGAVSDSGIVTTDETAPSVPPSSVATSSDNSSSITVGWGLVEPCIDRNGGITRYSVRYGVKDSGIKETLTVSGGNVYTVTIRGLSCFSVYVIEVAAITGVSGIGVYSTPITGSTRGLSTPGDYEAVQSGLTSILVTWTPSSNATGYNIEYFSGDRAGSKRVNGGSSSSARLTGLENGLIYTVSIVATATDLPNSASIRETVMLVSLPPGPVITPDSDIIVTSSTITVSWTVSPGVIRSELSWTSSGMKQSEVYEGRKNTTANSYTITNLRASTTYYITVVHYNLAGASSPFSFSTMTSEMTSSETSVMILGAVLAIVLLTAAVIIVISVTVNSILLRKLHKSEETTDTELELSNIPKQKRFKGDTKIAYNVSEPTYDVDPSLVQTSSNEAYNNIVRGTGGAGVEGDYEITEPLAPTPLAPPPSSSSQPADIDYGEYEPV